MSSVTIVPFVLIPFTILLFLFISLSLRAILSLEFYFHSIPGSIAYHGKGITGRWEGRKKHIHKVKAEGYRDKRRKIDRYTRGKTRRDSWDSREP